MLEIKLHLHHLPQFEIHCIKVISNEMRRDIFLQIKKNTPLLSGGRREIEHVIHQ